ncbi:hypothetical protein DFH06DRAFT_1308887, partial [Mycena polygramma]
MAAPAISNRQGSGSHMLLLGIVVMTTAASRSFTGTMINHFILGMLVWRTQIFQFDHSDFHRPLQQARPRPYDSTASNGVAGIFGDFLAYGLGHATNSKVPPWALIFLVLGAVWGVFMFLTLPDSPVFASFLSQRQKTIAVKRVAENRVKCSNIDILPELSIPRRLGQKTRRSRIPKFTSFKVHCEYSGANSEWRCVEFFQVWIYGLSNNSAGYPRQCQIVSLVLSGYLAGRFKNSRAIMMFIGNATCIVAAAALTYAPRDEKWGRLVAFWFTSFQSVGFSLSLVMIPANVGGFTKRQVTTSSHLWSVFKSAIRHRLQLHPSRDTALDRRPRL